MLAGWKSVARGGGLICHLGVEECFEIFDLYTVKNGANLRDLFFLQILESSINWLKF